MTIQPIHELDIPRPGPTQRSPRAPAARARFWAFLPACAIWLPGLPLVQTDVALAKRAAAARHETATIQTLVDTFRERLGITRAVTVSIVPQNQLMVSVESPKDPDGAFVMSFEETFLAELSEEELSAVVAHELGHVWIFTHHPYLQTEQLANRIALRVVSRGTLVNVYEKVWERGGTKGDLDRFLGQ